jgi:hypothetical protein
MKNGNKKLTELDQDQWLTLDNLIEIVIIQNNLQTKRIKRINNNDNNNNNNIRRYPTAVLATLETQTFYH